MIVDPGEPGELKGSLRAKDLVNKALLLRPVKEDTVPGQDGKPWHFVECDVVVLGMGGIEEHASGVRISWVRVIPQLADRIGQWVACRPKVQDDNSVALMAFDEGGKKKAADLLADAEKLFEVAAVERPADADDEFSSEPF